MGSGDVVDLGFRYLSYKERQRNREEAARRREEERKAAARKREIQATERIQRENQATERLNDINSRKKYCDRDVIHDYSCSQYELDKENNIFDHIKNVCVPDRKVPTRGAIQQFKNNNN